MNKELQALQDADFGWVQSLDSVWSNEGFNDAGPNQEYVDKLVRELAALKGAPSTPGRVYVGHVNDKRVVGGAAFGPINPLHGIRIKRIRAKCSGVDEGFDAIETVVGVGYRLRA